MKSRDCTTGEHKINIFKAWISEVCKKSYKRFFTFVGWNHRQLLIHAGMNSSTETIFVVEDDKSVRRSLSLFLTAAGYQVETYASAEEFLERELCSGAGCLILDVYLEGKSGLELQKKLVMLESHLPVIFITGRGNIPMSVDALRSGAINFLEKPFKEEVLLQSITEALTLSKKLLAEKEETVNARQLIESLTLREMEVLKYIITGMLNKQIASVLGIAEHTVKLHRHSICDKLAVKSLPEIIRIADKAGVVPGEKVFN
jgi:FixJ family two-component response regulator